MKYNEFEILRKNGFLTDEQQQEFRRQFRENILFEPSPDRGMLIQTKIVLLISAVAALICGIMSKIEEKKEKWNNPVSVQLLQPDSPKTNTNN